MKTITLSPALAGALIEALQPVIEGDAEAAQITLIDDDWLEIGIVCRSGNDEGEQP